MMQWTRWAMVATLAGAPLLSGCGGEASSVNSGVPADKTGDELSKSDIQDVCKATVHYAESKIDKNELLCRGIALYSGSLAIAFGDLNVAREACKSFYDSCLKDPQQIQDSLAQLGTDIPTFSDADCAGAPESLEDCPVTVGEYEDCATDRVNDYAAAVDGLPTCSTVTEADFAGGAEALLPQLDSPASCATIDSTPACAGAGLGAP